MLIYNEHGIRVLQHEYLEIYYIQQWMEGDDNRSYGRKYDYFTVRTSKSIEEVNQVVREMLDVINGYVPLSTEQVSVMKHYDVEADLITFRAGVELIGKQVQKRSNKPFKSTNKINTVLNVIRNPNTHRWAVTFNEDDSCVDVKQLKIV